MVRQELSTGQLELKLMTSVIRNLILMHKATAEVSLELLNMPMPSFTSRK
jgi:hypothetical protein